jgi:hypothetical protein
MGACFILVSCVKIVTRGQHNILSLTPQVDEIPLSRPKRNISRDFSDGGASHYFGLCALE